MSKKVLVFLIVCLNLQSKELDFETLEVSAKEIKNEEKSFVTPGAVSSRSEVGNSTQSIDSIVRSMPGSYTNTDQSQGTVQVNIRGMKGLGRVNTMVDGVTQTFFGTSADNGKFHTGQGSMSTSSFGTMVDKNFLTSVDVEKGTFSGGATGLMGSANFRTIGVDDLVSDGENFGFLGRYSYGTNGIGPSYMGSVAGKTNFNNSGSVGVLFGYSGSKINQNYKIGGGTKVGDQKIKNPEYPDNSDEEYINISPFNPKKLTQRPKSYLFKVELKPDEFNKAILNYRRYENSLAGRDLHHDNYQIGYNFAPSSDFIDINLLASYGVGKQKYDKDAEIFSRGDLAEGGNLKADNKVFIIDLNNKFKFNLTDELKMQSVLGINHMNNKYKNSLDKSVPGAEATPFQPKGTQKISTLYLDNSLEYNIFTFDTNLKLSKTELIGHKPECVGANPKCFPKKALDIKKDDTSFNYSFTLAAALYEFFSPFVSYSKITRPPNVQEMFFSNNYGDSINPFLKPEEAKTWQIGFNSYKHGLFNNHDIFGFKVVYYKTDIKNYIYDKAFYINDSFIMNLNREDNTEFKGFEVELSYDVGFFYTKASYSKQKDNQLVSETSSGEINSFSGYSEITKLPEDYATIDIGTRLMDEKITLGVLAKYIGKAKRVAIDTAEREKEPTNEDMFPQYKKEKLPKIPTIYDFYASYKPKENLTFKFEVQNVFDKNYMDALNSFNNSTTQKTWDADYNNVYLFSNSSRGRTFIGSFEYKF